MFKKGYWLIPVLIVVVTYFFYPEQMEFWEKEVVAVETSVIQAPAVEAHSVTECTYKNVANNGFIFRIERCMEEGKISYTSYVNGEVVDKFVTIYVVINPIHDKEFWEKYNKRFEEQFLKIPKVIKKNRDDI